MSTAIPYQNPIVSPTGGVNSFAGLGTDYNFDLSFTGTSGAEVTLILTDATTSVQTQVGFGTITGLSFNYVKTFNNKVYGLNAGTVYMSALGDPTTWNNPNGIGNGFITMSNYYASTENLVAMSPYQGRLAFFSQLTTQLWITDPNISNWELIQTLTNIGAIAALSVQSLGDLDVLFLSHTGIRSLRTRDNTLNAFVADVGTPIDTLIQTALLANNYMTACAVVEPRENRYWCYLNGVIYVFSYFPSNKILAWGTYNPTYARTLSASALTYPASAPLTVTYAVTSGYQYYWVKGVNDVSITDGVNTYTSSQSFVAQSNTLTMTGVTNQSVTAILQEQTSFTPQKFVVYNGQVYCRDVNNFYLYGGADNNTYDGCIATVATSWLDLGDPVNVKNSTGFDSAFFGSFIFSVGMDQLNETVEQVWMGNQPTFQLGSEDFSNEGYHFKMQAQTYDNQPAVLSNFIFRYEVGEEK